MNPMGSVVGQFFKEKTFCGLDIGSQRIKVSVSRVQDAENFLLLGVHEVETQGLLNTSVTDIGALSSAIAAAIGGVIKRSKVNFREVHLGLGGDMVEVRHSRALIPLTERGNRVIVPTDIRQARQQARLLGVRLDEEVIDDLVKQFRVDDVNVALDPVGLYGRKLEVESLLVIINAVRLRNVCKAVKQAGYEVSDVYFNGVALSEAVLTQSQRQQGALVIDVGAGKTDMLIFKDGLVKDFCAPDFSGDKISRRLAASLQIPFSLAEDVKKSYVCLGAGTKDNAEILLKKDQGFIPVKNSLISQLAQDEVTLFLSQIKEKIFAAGYDQLAGGVVIAGGGAQMTGLIEYMEKELAMPVVMARNIPGLNQSVLFAVSMSIAEIGYKKSFRYSFDKKSPKDWIRAAQFKIDELCNEYF